MERGRVIGALVLGLLLWTPAAWAGGYDTPMLYSARHMGMGGTAISGVNDASALFHNPAGMARLDAPPHARFLADGILRTDQPAATACVAEFRIDQDLLADAHDGAVVADVTTQTAVGACRLVHARNRGRDRPAARHLWRCGL